MYQLNKQSPERDTSFRIKLRMFIPIIMNEIPAGGNKDLTEECFQQTPLQFSGGDQWIQVGKKIT